MVFIWRARTPQSCFVLMTAPPRDPCYCSPKTANYLLTGRWLKLFPASAIFNYEPKNTPATLWKIIHSLGNFAETTRSYYLLGRLLHNRLQQSEEYILWIICYWILSNSCIRSLGTTFGNNAFQREDLLSLQPFEGHETEEWYEKAWAICCKIKSISTCSK